MPELWISVRICHKGLLPFLPFSSLCVRKLPFFSKFKFDSHIIWQRMRHRDVDAKSICFFYPLSLHQNFTVRPFILHPLLPPRTCSIPPPSRVKYTYIPDIFASHSSRFLFHSRGIKYPRTTRKAGCIEREKRGREYEREREREKTRVEDMRIEDPWERDEDKEREGERVRVLRESPGSGERGKRRLQGSEGNEIVKERKRKERESMRESSVHCGNL